MPDIFGTAGGTSAAIQDMERLAQTQGLQAQTQGQNLANEQSQMNLDQSKQMSQLMQQNAGGLKGMKPADQLEKMAELAMGAGLTAQGSKLATEAAGIRLKEAQSVHAQSQSINQQALAAKTELEMTDRLLNGVNDQQSWDAANSLFKQMTGRPSPFEGMDYNPTFVAHLQQHTLSLKDKLDLGIKQYNANTARENADSNKSFREFRQGVLTKDAETRRMREDRLQKGGGKNADVGVPGKTELDGALSSIKSQFPNLPADEANSAAFSIASRARALRKATPGMDADQALDRAIIEAKAQGQLSTVDDTYKVLGIPVMGGKHSHYSKGGTGDGAGSNPGNPIVGSPPEPQRKVGSYYKNSQGAVYRWTKEGWEVADAAK